MKKSKPVFDFVQYAIPEKISFFNHVNGQLYGNPLFPMPDIPKTEAIAKAVRRFNLYGIFA